MSYSTQVQGLHDLIRFLIALYCQTQWLGWQCCASQVTAAAERVPPLQGAPLEGFPGRCQRCTQLAALRRPLFPSAAGPARLRGLPHACLHRADTAAVGTESLHVSISALWYSRLQGASVEPLQAVGRLHAACKGPPAVPVQSGPRGCCYELLSKDLKRIPTCALAHGSGCSDCICKGEQRGDAMSAGVAHDYRCSKAVPAAHCVSNSHLQPSSGMRHAIQSDLPLLRCCKSPVAKLGSQETCFAGSAGCTAARRSSCSRPARQSGDAASWETWCTAEHPRCPASRCTTAWPPLAGPGCSMQPSQRLRSL